MCFLSSDKVYISQFNALDSITNPLYFSFIWRNSPILVSNKEIHLVPPTLTSSNCFINLLNLSIKILLGLFNMLKSSVLPLQSRLFTSNHCTYSAHKFCRFYMRTPKVAEWSISWRRPLKGRRIQSLTSESSSHCHLQLLCATVDMVNDDDYDLVSDSLLYRFVHLYKILIFSNQ